MSATEERAIAAWLARQIALAPRIADPRERAQAIEDAEVSAFAALHREL